VVREKVEVLWPRGRGAEVEVNSVDLRKKG